MRRTIFATAASLVFLSCASAQAAGSDSPSKDDPWEHLNRRVYSFNEGLDRALIRPAAMAYSHILPSPIRLMMRNIMSNLTEPNIIINDILQARPVMAAKATARFVMNSTIGIGGILDIASTGPLPHQDNSFSITLGRYGVKTGPYLYLPVVGPATVRGVVGVGVDSALDPFYWIRYPYKTDISISRTLAHGLDLRAESDDALKSLLNDATDPYATIRSAYLQNQQSMVSGENASTQALPDFDEASPPPAHPDAATPPASGADAPATPPATDAPASEPAPAPAEAPTPR